MKFILKKQMWFVALTIIIAGAGFYLFTHSKDLQARTPTSETASEKKCSAVESKKELEAIYDNFGTMPRFLIGPMLISIQECLGAQLYMSSLNDLNKRKSGGRTPAQQSPTMQSEFSREVWEAKQASSASAGYQNAELIFGTGLAAATVAFPPLAVASVPIGVTMGGVHLAYVAWDAASGAQADRVFAQIMDASKYDPKRLSDSIQPGMSETQAEAAFMKELQNQVVAGVPLDQLREKDITQVLMKQSQIQAQTGARVALATQNNTQAIQDTINNLGELTKDYQQFKETSQNHFKQLDGQVAGLNTAVDGLEQNVGLMQNLWMDRMTTDEKIGAIRDYGWGNFASDEDREKELAALEDMAEIESTLNTAMMYTKGISDVATILTNFGVEDENLGKILEVSQKAEKVIAGVTAIAMASTGLGVLGGVATLSSAFGGGGADKAASARHAQIMAALKQVIAMQKQILENQHKMMEMIVQLNIDMNNNFNDIRYRLDGLGEQIGAVQTSLAWNASKDLNGCYHFRGDFLRDIVRKKPFFQENDGITIVDDYVGSPMSTAYLQDQSLNELLVSYNTPDFSENSRLDDCLNLMKDTLDQIKFEAKEFGAQGIINLTGSPGGKDEVETTIMTQRWNVALQNIYKNHFLDKAGKLDERIAYSALNPSSSFKELRKKIAFINSDKYLEDIKTARQVPSWYMFVGQTDRPPEDLVINPVRLTELVNYVLDVYPMRYLQKVKGDRSEIIKSKVSVEHLRYLNTTLALIETAIVQQSLYYGDYIYELLEPEFTVDSPVPTKDDAIAFFADMNTPNLKRDIHFALVANPIFRSNMMRYKIYKMSESLPWIAYDFAYSYISPLTNAKDPSYINSFLSGLKLQAADVEGLGWVHNVRALDEKGFEAIKPQAPEAYNDVMVNSVVKLVLPTPAQFALGEMISSSFVNELRQSRQKVLDEILYYKLNGNLTEKTKNEMTYNSLLGLSL